MTDWLPFLTLAAGLVTGAYIGWNLGRDYMKERWNESECIERAWLQAMSADNRARARGVDPGYEGFGKRADAAIAKARGEESGT